MVLLYCTELRHLLHGILLDGANLGVVGGLVHCSVAHTVLLAGQLGAEKEHVALVVEVILEKLLLVDAARRARAIVGDVSYVADGGGVAIDVHYKLWETSRRAF